jgi:hypothetical protein
MRYPVTTAWSVPVAAARFGGVDGGECSADVVKLTWPSQVDDFKARLAPIVLGLDASIGTCAGMTADDRVTWAAQFATWKTFAAKPTPWFGSSNEWQTACSYAKTFDAWRDRLTAARCAIAGPNQIQVEKTNPVDLAKWIAIGVVAAGAVGVLFVYAPEIKGVLGRFSK